MGSCTSLSEESICKDGIPKCCWEGRQLMLQLDLWVLFWVQLMLILVSRLDLWVLQTTIDITKCLTWFWQWSVTMRDYAPVSHCWSMICFLPPFGPVCLVRICRPFWDVTSLFKDLKKSKQIRNPSVHYRVAWSPKQGPQNGPGRPRNVSG